MALQCTPVTTPCRFQVPATVNRHEPARGANLAGNHGEWVATHADATHPVPVVELALEALHSDVTRRVLLPNNTHSVTTAAQERHCGMPAPFSGRWVIGRCHVCHVVANGPVARELCVAGTCVVLGDTHGLHERAKPARAVLYTRAATIHVRSLVDYRKSPYPVSASSTTMLAAYQAALEALLSRSSGRDGGVRLQHCRLCANPSQLLSTQRLRRRQCTHGLANVCRSSKLLNYSTRVYSCMHAALRWMHRSSRSPDALA